MFDNSKSLYIESSSGNVEAVEIYEHHGKIMVEIGDSFRISIDPDDAFDIADALTLVANGIQSHVGGEWNV